MKATLKPYYKSRKITKDDYKHILRKCVPKVRLKTNVHRLDKIHTKWEVSFFLRIFDENNLFVLLIGPLIAYLKRLSIKKCLSFHYLILLTVPNESYHF